MYASVPMACAIDVLPHTGAAGGGNDLRDNFWNRHARTVCCAHERRLKAKHEKRSHRWDGITERRDAGGGCKAVRDRAEAVRGEEKARRGEGEDDGGGERPARGGDRPASCRAEGEPDIKVESVLKVIQELGIQKDASSLIATDLPKVRILSLHGGLAAHLVLRTLSAGERDFAICIGAPCPEAQETGTFEII